jgi:hypothetical protein
MWINRYLDEEISLDSIWKKNIVHIFIFYGNIFFFFLFLGMNDHSFDRVSRLRSKVSTRKEKLST